jgi:hypothetical protein
VPTELLPPLPAAHQSTHWQMTHGATTPQCPPAQKGPGEWTGGPLAAERRRGTQPLHGPHSHHDTVGGPGALATPSPGVSPLGPRSHTPAPALGASLHLTARCRTQNGSPCQRGTWTAPLADLDKARLSQQTVGGTKSGAGKRPQHSPAPNGSPPHAFQHHAACTGTERRPRPTQGLQSEHNDKGVPSTGPPQASGAGRAVTACR